MLVRRSRRLARNPAGDQDTCRTDAAMTKKKMTFEESLKQLETIAEQIERGQIGLEESIDRYEEGMSLVKQCREILSTAEHRIQQLQQRADGTLETAEFTPPKETD